MQIHDGRTNDTAHVDSNNRLATRSISETLGVHATEVGQKFVINTGDITLTTANKHSVLYIKNNSDSDLVVTTLGYHLGNTTDGVGDCFG